jgi:hypothetical protein
MQARTTFRQVPWEAPAGSGHGGVDARVLGRLLVVVIAVLVELLLVMGLVLGSLGVGYEGEQGVGPGRLPQPLLPTPGPSTAAGPVMPSP